VTMLTRRTALLLALALVATMAIAGVAYAKTIVGTNGNDINPPIRGTDNADTLYGLNGNEVILARGGEDEGYGGRGREDIWGMSGDD
jgi:Ca2+-binding RTX toxin-like protein